MFIHALAQRRFPRYLIDIHRAGEIELALYTIDRFKIILADTQQSQVAFDDIRVLDSMSHRYAGIQLTAEMSVSLDQSKTGHCG